jgi:ABC-2 type transport system ATP-binding protein
MRAMIDVQHLTKRYGGQLAVDDVSFACEPGTVTGFLGPNGAGKSTTMRMLCGLTPPTSGSARVAGVRYHDLPEPPRVAGVLLDASAEHAGRTGREALVVGALMMGLPQRRADELLEVVGLPRSAASKRVKQYSLGMRQRLGIARALLGDPQVLVLDEPANGLDPEGIRWMRTLLRDFADRGGTVLLSSHLLGEVQAIADRLLIIRSGRIVAEGTKNELLAGEGTVVRAGDAGALDDALAAAGLEASIVEAGLRVSAEPAAVGQVAASAGIALEELRPAGADLEELFMELTSQPQEVAA